MQLFKEGDVIVNSRNDKKYIVKKYLGKVFLFLFYFIYCFILFRFYFVIIYMHLINNEIFIICMYYNICRCFNVGWICKML